MRVSTIKTDPGYANYNGHHAYKVTLNCSPVPTAVTADEEGGVVVYGKVDQFGNLVFDVASSEIPLIEAIGSVRIERLGLLESYFDRFQRYVLRVLSDIRRKVKYRAISANGKIKRKSIFAPRFRA